MSLRSSKSVTAVNERVATVLLQSAKSMKRTRKPTQHDSTRAFETRLSKHLPRERNHDVDDLQRVYIGLHKCSQPQQAKQLFTCGLYPQLAGSCHQRANLNLFRSEMYLEILTFLKEHA